MTDELVALLRVIRSDAHAITFQSIGQYRGALLKEIADLLAKRPPVESLGRES